MPRFFSSAFWEAVLSGCEGESVISKGALPDGASADCKSAGDASIANREILPDRAGCVSGIRTAFLASGLQPTVCRISGSGAKLASSEAARF